MKPIPTANPSAAALRLPGEEARAADEVALNAETKAKMEARVNALIDQIRASHLPPAEQDQIIALLLSTAAGGNPESVRKIISQICSHIGIEENEAQAEGVVKAEEVAEEAAEEAEEVQREEAVAKWTYENSTTFSEMFREEDGANAASAYRTVLDRREDHDLATANGSLDPVNHQAASGEIGAQMPPSGQSLVGEQTAEMGNQLKVAPPKNLGNTACPVPASVEIPSLAACGVTGDSNMNMTNRGEPLSCSSVPNVAANRIGGPEIIS